MEVYPIIENVFSFVKTGIKASQKLNYILSISLCKSITTTTRSDLLPDVPTIADFLPGYEASNWYGIGTPRNTPPEIIAKLNDTINTGLADPQIKAQLVSSGGTMIPGLPADFGKLIAQETEKWAKVVKFAGVKPG